MQRPREVGVEGAEVWQQAIRFHAQSRRSTGRHPPSIRVSIGARAVYVRTLESQGTPPMELALIREEVIRDAEVFRALQHRLKITRREYDVLLGLRAGKTNREIAAALGISASTVAGYVGRLRERCDAKNRAHLVDIVQRLLSQRI